MKKDNNQPPQEPKRGFPGGFLIFLLAAVLIILTVQNLSGGKSGKVSFSHQVEHLVNMDLLHRDESKKIAQKDNLVTFSGHFKDELSTDAKTRYRFLELLNRKHELTEGKENLAKSLSVLQTDVETAAVRFLTLSGIFIPNRGYQVVGASYDTNERTNGIVIQSIPRSEGVDLPQVKKYLTQVSQSPNHGNLETLGGDLSILVQGFKSPVLGIGNESIKQELNEISRNVEKSLEAGTSLSPQEKLATYKAAITSLDGIVTELNQLRQNVRLVPLRSVRSYLEDLQQYNYVSQELETNVAAYTKAKRNVAEMTWFFNNQEVSTRALEKQDPEAYGRWFAQSKVEWENFAGNQGTAFKAPDQPRNLVLEKTFKSVQPSPNYFSYIFTILPIVLIILLLYFVFSRQMKGMGSGAMNFGKSPAKLLNQSENKITFKDVAGVEEAKEELAEIVDFLKDPTKFTDLGARIPKGVLCIGPPGTGKTLVAKAVAGEADRPFFSISGSDFVEMFVGVGASRIRDLFDQAKKNAPCIVFIDEIDAVGRHRGAGIGGGNDEREQTLNQLLVEMDGFDTNEGVILIAATNRPDVLDKALLRPGRFDRRVVLDLPDIKGRFEILKVHAKKIKLDDSVDLMDVARNTPGASGADLMNILNEAALLAARAGRNAVTSIETLEAADKVRYGKERRSLERDGKDKLHTAYHESGHAIVGLAVEYGDPVEKVTIIPRGMSLGATHFVPEKNKLSYWKKELLDRLAVLMGGRIAEEQFIGDISSGAQMDISQATKLARAMVCEWGMTDALGPVAYNERSEDGPYYLPGSNDKSYSDETAKDIDAEVRKILDAANQRATDIIVENRAKVELMTQMLLEFESLDKEDVISIMEDKWNADEKRNKMQKKNDAHRKLPPTPPSKQEKFGDDTNGLDPAPQNI